MSYHLLTLQTTDHEFTDDDDDRRHPSERDGGHGTVRGQPTFFYLTCAENACQQGTGSRGTNSQEIPRAGRSCP